MAKARVRTRARLGLGLGLELEVGVVMGVMLKLRNLLQSEPSIHLSFLLY